MLDKVNGAKPLLKDDFGNKLEAKDSFPELPELSTMEPDAFAKAVKTLYKGEIKDPEQLQRIALSYDVVLGNSDNSFDKKEIAKSIQLYEKQTSNVKLNEKEQAVINSAELLKAATESPDGAVSKKQLDKFKLSKDALNIVEKSPDAPNPEDKRFNAGYILASIGDDSKMSKLETNNLNKARSVFSMEKSDAQGNLKINARQEAVLDKIYIFDSYINTHKKDK